VLRILALGVPATFVLAVWSFGLLSLKHYRQLVLVNALMVATAIGLCVVLIPPYGARGAAVVTAALEVLLAAGYAIALMRRRADLRPQLRRVPRIALALTVAFVLALLLPIPSVAAAALGVPTFLLLTRAFGAMPDELLQAVSRRRSEA
jgi:O-antigen/teichoic acid export membrane protein